MTSPVDFYLKSQTAMGESWMRCLQQNVRLAEHFVSLYAKWMNHPDFARFQYFIPDGASWFDHYGKRHLDVDVEKV